jgi:hypothetical protein
MLAVAGLALLFYQPSVLGGSSAAFSGQGILSDLPLVFGRWAAMIGSIAVEPVVAMITGMVGITIWVVLLLNGSRRSSPSYISGVVIMTSMVLTASAVAVLRSELGFAQAIDSRYRIVSMVFWIVTAEMAWTHLLERGTSRITPLYRVAIGAMIVVSLVSSVFHAPRIIRHSARVAYLKETFSSGEPLPEGEWPIPGGANQIMEASEDLGITAYRRVD